MEIYCNSASPASERTGAAVSEPLTFPCPTLSGVIAIPVSGKKTEKQEPARTISQCTTAPVSGREEAISTSYAANLFIASSLVLLVIHETGTGHRPRKDASEPPGPAVSLHDWVIQAGVPLICCIGIGDLS